MSLHRRAGAPRLIEWTGERCVPWAPDVLVVYEHLHRYLWAARLVEGRRVLDLGSGEGFGAAILSDWAAEVEGIDVDETSVAHARLNYSASNLKFSVGDARDLSRFDDGSFGAVLAFEVIEHLTQQEQLVAEIARVLAPDGLVVISTPDRLAYNQGRAQENPFHLRELTLEELERLLKANFPYASVWCQRPITGSTISALAVSGPASDRAMRTFFVEKGDPGWRVVADVSPLYLIAAASKEQLPEWPSDSTLADADLELLRQVEREGSERAQSRQRELERAHAHLAKSGQEAARLRKLLADRNLEIETTRGELERYQAQLTNDDERIAALTHEVAALTHDVAEARVALWRVGRAFGANTVETLRGRIYYGLGGPGAPAVRLVQQLLRLAARLGGRVSPIEAEQPEPLQAHGPISLPNFAEPDVSIVIPVYGRADLTRWCLESIRRRTSHVSYEVILVNDGDDPATRHLLAEVEGARVIDNHENLGYLRSVNVGAAATRGRWLVLANNDIEVGEGWLAAMVDCAQSDPRVAIVTPKYIYPDGSLNEAGGIIWRDGTGWNYGRGDDSDGYRYGFRREVDYGSAAALLVNADFWRSIGGFDERYRPMYFEDVDLCFQARERGQKVVYEPTATVIHHEGASAGTSITSGTKRYQELNRSKFAEKWRHQLDAGHLTPDPGRVYLAANRRRGPHVLVADHRVPMWDRDAGSLRTRGMLETLLELGCRVSFLPDNLHPTAPYTGWLQQMGIEVMSGPLNVTDELIRLGNDLELVIVSHPEPASRLIEVLRRVTPRARIVYDTVDLHWVRETRHEQVRRGADAALPGTVIEPLGATAVALRGMETELIRASDAALVVTEEERRLVQADTPGKSVYVVPTVHSVRRPVPPLAAREGVVFVGGFEHPPNIDAAVRLVKRIMPPVWERFGEVSVKIVGGSAPSQLKRLGSERVEITGWVQEIAPLLDGARALVAPISFGAGLKGKITQALAYGLPVVTTPIGAEGLPADDDFMLVADDDDTLAEQVVRVLGDDQLWLQMSEAGQKIVADLCSPEVMTARLGDLLADLQCLSRPPAAGPRR